MKHHPGAFCETYGSTIENRILEYFLEQQSLDTAVGDLARTVGISRPKAYAVVEAFLKKGYLKKSRIVGRTQLFILNKENDRVKLFRHDFKECLKITLDEHAAKGKSVGDGNLPIAVSVKAS